jgi:hypothetical protein
MENLKGLKVAILVTDGFEEVELTRPPNRFVAFAQDRYQKRGRRVGGRAMLELFARGQGRAHQAA